jgi:Bacterial mobilisation protein (MobC).
MCIDGYTLNLDIPELKDISSMMSRTGGNLNQIARHLNSGGNIYGDEFAGIQESFNCIREQFGKIIMSLAKLKGFYEEVVQYGNYKAHAVAYR